MAQLVVLAAVQETAVQAVLVLLIKDMQAVQALAFSNLLQAAVAEQVQLEQLEQTQLALVVLVLAVQSLVAQ
jgi:hypothetical protein